VDHVAPAVVTVRIDKRSAATATTLPPQFEEFFGQPFGAVPRGLPRPERQGGLGSGVVIESNGYILTNHHVVDGADSIHADFADGRSLPATLIGSDEASDLAVIRVNATGLATVPYGDSDGTKVGDVVLAFGNPLGVGQTVTMGIISAKSRTTGVDDGRYEDFLQTDAPINHGNSGGALVNLRGELVGINAQIMSPSGGNIGLGFAIPSAMAKAVADQLMNGGVVHRSKLGIGVQRLTPELAEGLGLSATRGAVVSQVEPGSPGDRAGLRAGDVVTALDGKPIGDVNALRNQVAASQPGSSVSLAIVRDGKPMTVTARLVERSDRAAAREQPRGADGTSPRFGMTVAPLTPDVADEMGLDRSAKGLVVTAVEPSSPAAAAGVQAGDLVKSVNGLAVSSAPTLREALAARADKPALMLVTRKGSDIFLALSRTRG
jgi:Do/DeqQ family serine protease